MPEPKDGAPASAMAAVSLVVMRTVGYAERSGSHALRSALSSCQCGPNLHNPVRTHLDMNCCGSLSRRCAYSGIRARGVRRRHSWASLPVSAVSKPAQQKSISVRKTHIALALSLTAAQTGLVSLQHLFRRRRPVRTHGSVWRSVRRQHWRRTESGRMTVVVVSKVRRPGWRGNGALLTSVFGGQRSFEVRRRGR